MTEDEKFQLYVESEKKGRDIFLSFLNQFNHITNINEYEVTNPLDLEFYDSNENKWYVIELKNRPEEKRQYWGHMIEKRKWTDLLLDKKIPLYVNIFGDYMYIYDRNALHQVEWSEINRSVKTMYRPDIKHNSMVGNIDKKYSKLFIYNKEKNQWIKSTNENDK